MNVLKKKTSGYTVYDYEERGLRLGSPYFVYFPVKLNVDDQKR